MRAPTDNGTFTRIIVDNFYRVKSLLTDSSVLGVSPSSSCSLCPPPPPPPIDECALQRLSARLPCPYSAARYPGRKRGNQSKDVRRLSLLRFTSPLTERQKTNNTLTSANCGLSTSNFCASDQVVLNETPGMESRMSLRVLMFFFLKTRASSFSFFCKKKVTSS